MKQTNFYIIHIYNQYGNPPFMVMSEEPLTTKQVIEKCKAKRLLDSEDARDAYVVNSPLTEDIVKYKHPYKI